ncbi:peroxiredoxin [Alteribacillus sp. YIM 98480]|uniref:peroxiredoxin family protein n=1 Tax=Alteribacillus sp. YIM 98480 TaxID=2606599 RepID=UPI00131E9D55|nr:TlpA disulfide reductase family protein [Alteribacillus sp. YIM 98480]
MNKKFITSMVLVAAIIIISYVIFTNISAQEVGTQEGDAAADFTLPSYNGEERSLSSYEGNIVIMNMWASWCEPCTEEIPELMEFHEQYEEQGVVVLTINMNSFERKQEHAEKFVEQFDMRQTPALIDEEGEVADLYNLQYLPTTYIITRDGTIAEKIAGEIDFKQLEEKVADQL